MVRTAFVDRSAARGVLVSGRRPAPAAGRLRSGRFEVLANLLAAVLLAIVSRAADAQTGTDPFGPAGANVLRAHSVGGVTGAGTARVGIIEWAHSAIDEETGVGVRPNSDLGDRLLSQWNFAGIPLPLTGNFPCCNLPCRITPPAAPPGESRPTRCPRATPEGDSRHATLVADIIARVAPAAKAHAANISAPANNELQGFHETRAAVEWLTWWEIRAPLYLNLSFGYLGHDESLADQFGLYLDYRNPLSFAVVAAGNEGAYIRRPADQFNGITVGATDETFRRRWQEGLGGPGSSYLHILPEGGWAAKPEILAPGKNILGVGTGTSFAAPFVTGTLALLHEAAGAMDPMFLKAALLNAARKRYISGENQENAALEDDETTNEQTTDRNYLTVDGGAVVLRPLAGAASTGAWTPAEWTKEAAGPFRTTRPLDDELGVGALDAARAIAQMREGNLAGARGRRWIPDQERPEPAVPRVGFGVVYIGTYALNEAARFTLEPALTRGTFITATLCWNRSVCEIDSRSPPVTCDPGGGAGPQSCGPPLQGLDPGDRYRVKVPELSCEAAGARPVPNLVLRVIFSGNGGDEIIAESDAPNGNLEHLHIPVPHTAAARKYRLEVWFSGEPRDSPVYAALAWWVGDGPAAPGCPSRARSVDCNTNDIDDECDLAAGTSADCNTNLAPDECDIASGGSPDLDADGVPDECAEGGAEGDLDSDGDVDGDDIRGFVACFFAGGATGPCAAADMDGDGDVDADDVALFIAALLGL